MLFFKTHDQSHRSLAYTTAILLCSVSLPGFSVGHFQFWKTKNQIQVQLANILFLLLLFGNNKNESEPLSIWFLDFGLEKQ